jgi:hypothetical protein
LEEGRKWKWNIYVRTVKRDLNIQKLKMVCSSAHIAVVLILKQLLINNLFIIKKGGGGGGAPGGMPGGYPGGMSDMD